MLKFPVGLGLATALLAVGCAPPSAGPSPPAEDPSPFPAKPPLAIGTPVGPEPEGWEDLRDEPFELHLLPDTSSGRSDGSIRLSLELRPGGMVTTDFDGTRALAFGLYRNGMTDLDELPVTYGSGATGTATSPGTGDRWEAGLPLRMRPPPGETVLREVVLEIEFLRLLESKDTEVSLDAGGVIDPVPPPLAKTMSAAPTRIWLSNPGFRKRGEKWTPPPYPFDPMCDLWQGRDSRGRRIHWTGQSIGGGTDDSRFTVRDGDEEPIAYPVAMRFRMPVRWSAPRTYRFVARYVPLPR